MNMNRTTRHQLSRTHGKNGLAPLPAMPDPAARRRALLDAVASATTWREPEPDDDGDDYAEYDVVGDSAALGLQIAQCGHNCTVLTVDDDGALSACYFGAAATTPDDVLS